MCGFFIVRADFSRENTSQSPAPDQSPSPSPSTTPVVRAPSPTPLPGAQNFHQWGAVTVFNGLPSDSVRTIAANSGRRDVVRDRQRAGPF